MPWAELFFCRFPLKKKIALQLFTLPLLFLALRAAAQQEPSFNVHANLVPVPALVKDGNESVVYGLRAQDFIMEDDGVEQRVHLDETAEAEPIFFNDRDRNEQLYESSPQPLSLELRTEGSAPCTACDSGTFERSGADRSRTVQER